MNEYIDPRSRLSRMGGGAADGALPSMPQPETPRRCCAVRATCSAYYQMKLFRHRPRGARGRRHQPRRSAATRSTASPASRAPARPRCIKTIAGAIRPPLNVVGGSVRFSFRAAATSIELEPEELARDPLEAPVLHHAGLDERAEPGAPDQARLRRFRLPPHRPADAGVHRPSSRPSASGCTSSPRCSTPIRTSCPAACASA